LEVKLTPRIIHFEIATDNPERAAKFYKKVFGWKIQKWSGSAAYWLVTTGKDEGGKVLMPKRAVPGVGYMAYCVDTEGIVSGIMQSYPQAK